MLGINNSRFNLFKYVSVRQRRVRIDPRVVGSGVNSHGPSIGHSSCATRKVRRSLLTLKLLVSFFFYQVNNLLQNVFKQKSSEL